MPKIDMERANRALARLQQLAKDHPELLGESAPDEWEETLRGAFMEDVYTTEEVAGFLKLSKITIYREIKRGNLKAAKIGKDYRISRHDLEAYYRSLGGGTLFGEQEGSERDGE